MLAIADIECLECGGPLLRLMAKVHCADCGGEALVPQDGPQSDALASDADITIYGGAAGGGKTWAMLYRAIRDVETPGFAAVIFRRLSTQITGSGSLWEAAADLFPEFGGESREYFLDWRFETEGKRSMIEFRHLQYEKDRIAHDGREYAFIAYDELIHFTAKQFWYLNTRNRTTCGVTPKTFATTNPQHEGWVRDLVAWWIGDDGYAVPERSGVLRWFARVDDDLVWGDSVDEVLEKAPGFDRVDIRSMTFIHASLEDNAVLNETDPGYAGRIKTELRVERERLGGSWNSAPSPGDYYRRNAFEMIDAPPVKAANRIRCWDLAGTKPSADNQDPDYTCGLLVSVDKHSILTIEHMELMRDGPGQVEDLLLRVTANDGKRVWVGLWQDPAQAGKAQVAHLKKMLFGYIVKVERAGKDKVSYAKAPAAHAQGGGMRVVRADWNDAFFRMVEAFPRPGTHDDPVDCLSLAFLKLSSSNIDRLRALARGG